MKRIFSAALIAAVFLSCEPPVRRALLLTFNDAADLVTISASTFLGKAGPGSPEAAQIADEREALLAGRDEWSIRFANADAESDRVILQRTRGELQSLEHIAAIAPEKLQKFFFDTPLTVTFTRGDGWVELTIYPGSSQRANRREREHVEQMLALYSEMAAKYFEAVRALYTYLDEHPQRAADMFTAVFRDDKDPPARVSETEQSFVDGVRTTLFGLATGGEETQTLDRDADLVFNPFPAELKVVVPGEITAIEGFTRQPDRSVMVKMPNALEAVSMLEGRWITPDPLAAAMTAPQKATADQIAATIADLPRRAEAVVTASDIAAAIKEKLRPAPRYRLRWIVKKGLRTVD